MPENKFKIGITQGDTNGIGWEIILKALADPVRVKMMSLLFSSRPGEETSGDLAAVLDLSESTVSHHLGQLRKDGGRKGLPG